jgi:transcriptional regulator with XRE-family HTH domain
MARSFDSARAALAYNVHRLRALRGLSQNRLAKNAKVTPGQISAIERAKANPTMESLQRIASVLGVELGALFVDPDRKA